MPENRDAGPAAPASLFSGLFLSFRDLLNFKWWQSFAVTTGIASLFLWGATLAVVLSFGATALIYLIAEELLVETIGQEKSLFPMVMLFTGFLVLLALKLLG